MECKKHKFKPRYEYRFPEWFSNISSIKHGYSEGIDALKEKIYICDICVKCGKKIYR